MNEEKKDRRVMVTLMGNPHYFDDGHICLKFPCCTEAPADIAAAFRKKMEAKDECD